MTHHEPTEDYYSILEVAQTASTELITQAYKRLALELHSDRNPNPNAVATFQLLGEAYETLKDDDRLRAYDRIYPSILQELKSKQKAETQSQSNTLTTYNVSTQPESYKREQARRRGSGSTSRE
jgi:curved DNA-binding protein CbpA